MRLLKVGLVVVLILVLGWCFTGSHNSAKATDACTITVTGTVASVNCGGVDAGTVQLPVVKVTTTLPPVPQPTKTVKVSGPKIRVPGPTQTVTVPGPVRTKIIRKPVKTVTVQPQPSSLPSPTFETPTGQTTPDHAMIGPATPMTTTQGSKPILNFGDGKITVVEAGIGIVTTLILIGMLLGMYYVGYTFGFREADSKNAKFMNDILDENA